MAPDEGTYMGFEIRDIAQNEWPLLEDFLYEAIFVPEGFEEEVPRSVICARMHVTTQEDTRRQTVRAWKLAL